MRDLPLNLEVEGVAKVEAQHHQLAGHQHMAALEGQEQLLARRQLGPHRAVAGAVHMQLAQQMALAGVAKSSFILMVKER
jgi:hypothetical protein